MTPSEEFNRAVANSKSLPERPDNATMLKLYALYKQATGGDASGERPDISDFVARAKWDAWHELSGTAPADAEQHYIDLIAELKEA
jgi:diazepam-binding inhibitor (GABA receptor modulator, acyl-CoA-binding protein)